MMVGTAKVAKAAPKSGSKRSTALSTPSMATWIRSSSGSPLWAKRLAQCSASQRWSSMSWFRSSRSPVVAVAAETLVDVALVARARRGPAAPAAAVRRADGGSATGSVTSTAVGCTCARVPPRSCVGYVQAGTATRPARRRYHPNSARVASAARGPGHHRTPGGRGGRLRRASAWACARALVREGVQVAMCGRDPGRVSRRWRPRSEAEAPAGAVVAAGGRRRRRPPAPPGSWSRRPRRWAASTSW